MVVNTFDTHGLPQTLYNVNGLHVADKGWYYSWLRGPYQMIEIQSRNDVDCLKLVDFLTGKAPEHEPLVEWVRLGGDWVVVKWSDGTVTKLKPQDGDEYDPLVGLLAMAFRKVGRNRLRYAKFDGVADAIAKGDFTSDDLRYLADTLEAVADGMDCEGFDREYRPAPPTKVDE